MISIPKKFSLGILKTAKTVAEIVNSLMAYQKPITLTDASIVLWDMSLGYNSKITLGGNRTLILQNLTVGDYGTIKIVQDAVGSRALTLPTNYTNKVANAGTGALTLTTTASHYDIATFYYDGEVINWTLSTDFT